MSASADELPRILLVEDEEAHAELVRRAFEVAGVEVELAWARSLREARASLSDSRPDLIVADLRLPDGDGGELLQGDRDRAALPVVIMTSHGDEREAVSAMRTGALDYVVKSEATLAEMPRIVQRALREWGHVKERRRAEEALRESEEHFRLLTENALDMISVLSPEMRILYMSPSCERLLGYRPEELVGSDALELVHPEDRATAQRALERAFAESGAVESYAIRLRARNGRWRTMESIGSAHRHAREGVRAVINSRDVTERVQAEAERRRLEAQLRHARKMETLGTLAGGIAHDFNNILQAIVGCTELAQHVLPPDNPAAAYLTRVVDGTGRARKLVRQILTFSRQDEPERRRIPLQKVVDESLALLRATLPSTIEIRNSGAGGGFALADPTQLQQVLMNLCTNAQHAMEGVGGVLDIELGRFQLDVETARAHPPLAPGPVVRLSVRDTGCGMSEEVKERIFEPFFSTRDVGKGTGLGLSVAHGIVASHGGAITVESSIGQGSVFHVFLPEAEAEAGEASAATESAQQRPPGACRILYVDDEESLLVAGKGLLERYGHSVTVKNDGAEALAAFRADPDAFDVVITDQTMPRLTGVQLARELRSLRPELPVVITTGYSENVDPESAQQLGAAAFLAKPFGARELVAVLRSVLPDRG